MRVIVKGPSGKTETFATKSKTVLIGRLLPTLSDQLGLDDAKVSGRPRARPFSQRPPFLKHLKNPGISSSFEVLSRAREPGSEPFFSI